MAQQLGEDVGDTVGYRIRFESRVSARTRVEVVTEGILTRMIQDDPTLEGIGALLFDEFHERHLSADLGLALALDVQSQLREELRIVVMSATLDGERLAKFLDAPRLSSAGRSFPIAIAHFPVRRDEKLEFQIRRCVEHALAAHPGDLLVFLPGQREIAQAQNTLADLFALRDIGVLPLHGELPLDALGHAARRARGDRCRAGARAALRPQLGVFATGKRRDFASVRGSARGASRSNCRRLVLSPVARVAATGTAASC